jgi:glutamyl-tRNA synthetase
VTVTTRFAPSPTGYLHIGGVRTALYAWLYARHHGGRFLLRIEDTDPERSTQEAVDAIIGGMAWLGLDADAAPIYQTTRFPRYAEVIESLIAQGKAYRCYCSREEIERMRAEAQARGEKPRYDGRCRDRTAPVPGVAPVVRFRNPDSGHVVLDDLVKGRIVFANEELDDLIIARSDGTPTYNFTVVVDDADMKITHVIRGDDHVNNTPRQINMFRALGGEPPAYAHLPMINGPDGAKLSKRHGAISVLEYRNMGFLPDGLLNYLLRLGWSHGDQEIFSRAEMIEYFDLPDVNRSASNFDHAKLLWVNQQHLMVMPTYDLERLLAAELRAREVDLDAGPPLAEIVAAYRERSTTIIDMADQAMCYFVELEEFEEKAAKNHLRPVAADLLRYLATALASLETWDVEQTQRVVEEVAATANVKLGKVAQPLRVALTGQSASPGIGVTLALAGRARSLKRIEDALSFIEARAATPDP